MKIKVDELRQITQMAKMNDIETIDLSISETCLGYNEYEKNIVFDFGNGITILKSDRK